MFKIRGDIYVQKALEALNVTGCAESTMNSRLLQALPRMLGLAMPKKKSSTDAVCSDHAVIVKLLISPNGNTHVLTVGSDDSICNFKVP